MPRITVSDLSKNFGTTIALDDLSFEVRDGEFFTLLGPSGCGKSTTLSALAGLEAPDSGVISAGNSVYVDSAKGRFLPPEERNLGMVFQSYALWPHMTVRQNLNVPLRLRNVGKRTQHRLVDETLAQVGLESFADRYSHELSGGQQQRVALARALVYSPDLLLLDEPLSNLDAKLREQARTWLKGLQQEIGITTVYVTHDQTEALTLSDRIAVMRYGRMLQIGTPEQIYERPNCPEVAEFIGRCNFLDAVCERDVLAESVGRFRVTGTEDVLNLLVHEPHRAGESVVLGIRAERMHVHSSDSSRPKNSLHVDLEKCLYAGSTFEYVASVAGSTLIVEDVAKVEIGPAFLEVKAEGNYVFNHESRGRVT